MTFLNNILSDMRDKHLLPVALGLIVVAIAIPLLLKKDAKPQPASQAALPGASAAASGGQSFVTPSSDASIPSENPLVGFKKKNPFIQQGVPKPGSKAGSTSATSGNTTSPGQTSGTGTTGGGSTSGTSTTDQSTSGKSPSEIRLYRWAVDLKFGVEGKDLRSYNDLTSVTVFPSESNPIVSLMGVTQTGDAAIFMLSEGVTQGGEGTCKPSKADCTFLYLRESTDKNRHTVYRDPSRKYTLKLERIRLKPTGKSISPDKVASGSSAGRSKSKQARAGSSSTGRAAPSLGTVGGKQ